MPRRYTEDFGRDRGNAADRWSPERWNNLGDRMGFREGRDRGHGFGYESRPRGHGGDYRSGGYGFGRGGYAEPREQGRRMRAAEIMTEDPATVTPEATLTDAATKMKELDVGIIPVVESETSRRLKGVITDRDIAVRAVAEGKDGKTRVADCMTTDVETCNKNDDVRSVLQVMRREQVRRVPITDREGRLVGIIAQADVEVDYAGDRSQRERRVQDTVQQISQPASPERAGQG
jgi:CBS domain-containing protein